MSSRARTFASAAFILGFLGFLYLRTLAPGLTWANEGADGGDLIAAAVRGGVPHPTGYPTYLLIASAFLRLPFGSLAYRTNLLSAACMVGAALLVALVVRRAGGTAISAVIAGTAFGTFPLAWSQAIITEVNALHAAFIAAILCMTLSGGANAIPDLALGLLAGLGLGNHMSTLLALPLLAIKPGSGEQNAMLTDFHGGIRRAAGLLLGLLVYAVIPLRAATQAPVNWGNATNLSSFLWLVSGQAYWGRLGHFDASYLWAGFGAWSRFLLTQLGVVGLALVFVALAFAFKRSRLLLATSWLAAAYSVFAILYYSPDSYVYLLPVLISVAIWIGMASQWLVERIPNQYSDWRPAASCLLLATFLARAVLGIPAMDLSKDHAAEDFAARALEAAPQGAILLATGDEATFSLWYRHFAERERPDVAVVSIDLLLQPWYAQVLTRTYPDLVLPRGSFPGNFALLNPGRPVCNADIETPGRLNCQP